MVNSISLMTYKKKIVIQKVHGPIYYTSIVFSLPELKAKGPLVVYIIILLQKIKSNGTQLQWYN